MRTIDEPKYFICTLATQAARKMTGYYNRVLSPLGLTAQQVMALGVIWREEDISLGTFARRSGVGKAAAVTMIKRLDRMGLVETIPDPEDARLNKIRLTEKSRRMAPKLLKKAATLEKEIEKAVGKKNMQALIKGLTIIKDIDL
jgi:MarR family transcriptional regulator, organic hydroperoxide resistance regulator